MNNGESKAAGTDQPDSASKHETIAPQPQFVADAVVLLMVLRDVVRIGRNYPDAVPASDHKVWLEEVTAHAEAVLQNPGLTGIITMMKSPELLEMDDSDRFGLLMSTALLSHPAIAAPGSTPSEVQLATEKAFGICQETASARVKEQMSRLANVMIVACRCPTGDSVKEFAEPARFLQMANHYWRLASDLVQIQATSKVGFNPHPLLHIIENIRDRLKTCFTHLSHLDGAADAGQACDDLVSMLTEGDIDDLSAVEEWANGEIQKIELFIARARMTLGGREYELTAPEVFFIPWCEQLIIDHKKRLQSTWKKILANVDADAARQAVSPMSAPSEGPSRDASRQNAEAIVKSNGTDWREVQRRLLELYKRGEQYTSIGKFARQLHSSNATVKKAVDNSTKLKGWQARHLESKRSLRATSLYDAVTDNAKQAREADPAKEAEMNDEDDVIFSRLIQEATTDEQRAQLNAMSLEQRRDIIAVFRESPDMGDRVLNRRA